MTQYSGKVIRRNPVTPTQQSASGVWKLTDQAAAIRNNTWPIAGVPDPISRSVRLRSSASAYFNRTPAIAGNRRTWTWSGWVKRGAVDASFRNLLVVQSAGNTYTAFGFNSSNNLVFGQDTAGVTNSSETTAAVFRDPSAWYHVVLAIDTTQATAANRVRLFINGAQVSTTVSAQIAQNADTFVNSTTTHYIGSNFTPGNFFDGYLTEINFIDGQALTPSSFGTTDSLTGAWIPLPYTGTYGTNGFYLDFRDNTSTTTLGLDYSGNSNNWTANNISLTAGSTYDSMLDVPTPWIGYSATTDTSAVTRGNYAVLNPLSLGSTVTLSNANLTMTEVGTYATTVSSIAMTSGKWYAEMTVGSNTFAGTIGIAKLGYASTSRLGFQANTWSYNNDGGLYYNSNTLAVVSSYTTNDVIGIAFDADNLTITFYKNNVQQGTQYTAANSGLTAGEFYFATGHINSTSNWNFGQRPFSYAPPSGFKTLCATNLPTPTILNGAQFMAATTYTGNGSTQSIVNTVNGVSFQPDLVWIKVRSTTGSHVLQDSVRGPTAYLQSNATAAENTNTANDWFRSFNSNGFTVAGSTTGGTPTTEWNGNGNTFVGWQWNAGGSNATNTSGTITSTVRASTTAGFSVVTFTGNGSTGTVGHGLGVAPRMIIQKPRNSTGSWAVYHASLGAGNAVWLNLTDASASYPTVWNSTTPTSSVYSVGSYMGTSNYVAYCFAQIAGFSAFGSYTGNGSTDGPFVFCGFRPRWVMIKRTDTTGNWYVLDAVRSSFNLATAMLAPNLSAAEFTSTEFNEDMLSNGFKLRTANVESNASGGTYIFAAFAENPFKYSNAR